VLLATTQAKIRNISQSFWNLYINI